MYLPVNVWQHISYKNAKKEDYRIVYSIPTISKAGTEYIK